MSNRTVRELANLGYVISDKVEYGLRDYAIPRPACSIEISIVGDSIFISAHNINTGAKKLISILTVDEVDALFLDYKRVVDRILEWAKEAVA